MITLGATIMLVMLGYLIKALLSWGKLDGRLDGFQIKLTELFNKTNETEKGIADIRREMLRPADLKAALLEMQLQVLKESMTDNGSPRARRS